MSEKNALSLDALSDFITVFAHDLNNVLGAIRLCAEMQEMMAEQPEKQAHYRQQIMRTVDDELPHLFDLMVFAGKRNLPAMEHLADDALKTLLAPFNVAFFPGAPDTLIKVNLTLFQRTVSALIANARDFGATEIVVRTACVQNPLESGWVLSPKSDASCYFQLSVSDNGCGISSENLERIFQPYFSTKNPKTKHAGMGLALVYGALKAAGGGIALQTSSQGSVFTLYYPVA